MPKLFGGKMAGLVAGLGLAGVLAFGAAPAHATIEIQLQSGAQTLSAQGTTSVAVDQSLGNFLFNLDAGLAGPAPALDLSSLNLSSSAGGTLVITLSENDITSPIGLAEFITQFSGNFAQGSATVSLASYIDDSNTLLGTGTQLASLSSSDSPFALNSGAMHTTTGPFALTEVLTVQTTGLSQTSLDGSVAVPEPASLGLLGAGLFGIGMVRRRRNRAA